MLKNIMLWMLALALFFICAVEGYLRLSACFLPADPKAAWQERSDGGPLP